MAYIGKEPIVGNFQVCDAITTSATATFNLLVSSVAVFPETENNVICSLNGVVQKPGSGGGFTISGSTIIFNSALTSADVIDFILILGSVLSVGTPTDRTVTLAKMSTGTDGNIISYDASGNPVAIATGNDGQVLTSAGAGQPPAFEAAAAGGKVGQVVSTAKTDTTSTTSTSYVDVSGMTVAITPAATSSKVLVLVMAQGSLNDGGLSFKVIRDSTDILIGDAASNRARGVFGGTSYLQSHMQSFNYSFLDSPSSTSEVIYKVQWLTQSAKTNWMNRASYDSDLVYYTRGASTITAMEILA